MADRLPRGQLEHGPGGWSPALWAWPMGPGTSPRGGRPVTSAGGMGAAQPANAAYGGRGPDAARRADPASGAALARPRALEPPPQRGATGPGRHRPPGGAGRRNTAPGDARGRRTATVRNGRVIAGGDRKRPSSPPPPRLIKALPSAARQAYLVKTAGDGGDERQTERPRSPNEGGRGHRIAARERSGRSNTRPSWGPESSWQDGGQRDVRRQHRTPSKASRQDVGRSDVRRQH